MAVLILIAVCWAALAVLACFLSVIRVLAVAPEPISSVGAPTKKRLLPSPWADWTWRPERASPVAERHLELLKRLTRAGHLASDRRSQSGRRERALPPAGPGAGPRTRRTISCVTNGRLRPSRPPYERPAARTEQATSVPCARPAQLALFRPARCFSPEMDDARRRPLIAWCSLDPPLDNPAAHPCGHRHVFSLDQLPTPGILVRARHRRTLTRPPA